MLSMFEHALLVYHMIDLFDLPIILIIIIRGWLLCGGRGRGARRRSLRSHCTQWCSQNTSRALRYEGHRPKHPDAATMDAPAPHTPAIRGTSSDALSFAPELERGPILFLFVVG